MSKFFMSTFAAFAVTVLTASTLMAQDVPLPGPGGPDDRPTPPAHQPTPPPPVSNSGPLEPFPNQGIPSGPVENEPVVYSMGSGTTLRSGSRDFVFSPSSGYNKLEVIGVVGLSSNVTINSVRVNYRNGSSEYVYRLAGTYRANQGNVAILSSQEVASIIVNASNAGGAFGGSASFRIDVKATR